MLIESLESRQFLAADPLAGASSVGIHMRHEGYTLRVTTLSADNTLRVWKENRYVRIDVSGSAYDNNGNPISSRQENMFDADKIRKIVIDTGAGNDTVEVSGRIKSHVTVYAGQGSDTVSTGAGNDQLFGGDDLDYLVGNAGDDFIDGGNGDDRITATGGTDEVWGNLGHDRLTVASFGHFINGGAGSDIATLRDAPQSVVRVERYTQHGFDLIPSAVQTDGIAGVTVSPSRGVNLDLFTHGQRFAYTVSRGENTGRVDVSLLGYRTVIDPHTIVEYAPTQTIYLGRFQPGDYTIRVHAAGNVVGSTVVSVG